MITSIQIENFRGIQKGELNDLTPLVILVGPNNSGKSTVLDAMLISECKSESSTQIPKEVVNRRSVPEPFRWLSYHKNGVPIAPFKIQIIESDPQPKQRICRHLQEASTHFISDPVQWKGRNTIIIDPSTQIESLPELFSKAMEYGRIDEINSFLKELIPDFESLVLLIQNKKTELNINFSTSGARPVALEGEGIVDLIGQALQMASPPGSLVLMEEPETHLHPGAMRQTAKLIWAAISRDIQVVLTTHSLDFIDFLLEQAPKDKIDQLSLYFLALKDSVLSTSRKSGEQVVKSRTEFGEDLR